VRCVFKARMLFPTGYSRLSMHGIRLSIRGILNSCSFAQFSAQPSQGTMTDLQIIGPGPADPDISHDRVSSLPYDLLKEASRRLEIMSLIAASLWVLGTIGDRIALLAMTHGDRTWLRPQATDVIAGISVLASLALRRRRLLDP